MKIKEITSQNRRDFRAIMKCEFCEHETLNNSGYDDTYYHGVVIPAIICEECKKSTKSEGGEIGPIKTKYPDNFVISLLLLVFSSISAAAYSNNIQITNLSIPTQNTSFHYSMVQFDLSWDGSWRTSTLESNYDGAWVFGKFRKQGSTVWNHCTLGTSGHQSATGSTINAPSDGKGVFVYKDADAIGSNTFTGMKLRWEYGTDGVADGDKVELCIFGIEMVYIPQGSFYVGDGTATGPSTYGQFETAYLGIPYHITSEATPATLGGSSMSSMGNNNAQGMDPAGLDDFNDATAKALPAAFPKGYNAFWIMKYEVSQEQYVQFLNKLTYTQQARRTQEPPNSPAGRNAFRQTDNTNTSEYRNGIDIKTPGVSSGTPAVYGCNLNNNGVYDESDDGANIACNFMHFTDCEAYLDWAGLRPITELEYEKACRGTVFPVAGEYAWGNTSVTSAISSSLNNTRTELEISSNSASNCAYSASLITTLGPIRTGSFSQAATNRAQSGGSYYGVMDMSGNTREMIITLGNATGRAFTGTSGDGVLAASGEAAVTGWPSGFQADASNAVGAGYRGGDWGETDLLRLRVSERNAATYPYKWRDPQYGFRGGRTAN
jgi:Uncharacterized conserved protein